MIIPEQWADSMAKNLVGEDVIPILLNVDTKKPRELPIDRFALDDDGYYLVNANLRVPTKAILRQYHNPNIEEITLQLDEYSLKDRELCGVKIPWQ
jgi:hypothetical protein